jgi:hypothetical protein
MEETIQVLVDGNEIQVGYYGTASQVGKGLLAGHCPNEWQQEIKQKAIHYLGLQYLGTSVLNDQPEPLPYC